MPSYFEQIAVSTMKFVNYLRLLRNIWTKLTEILREKAPIPTVKLRTHPNEKKYE